MSLALPAAIAPLRAAQYLRMSTDYQQYSLENQAAGIASFAAANNLKIVRTYLDEGRSGLKFGSRYGLQDLIDDIQVGQSDFEVVLVFDVSRWGRFQDVDESAHYEFLCRQAGVRVLYCAEPLGNSLVSMLQCERRSASFDASAGRLTIHPALTVSILIVRCNQSGTGSIRWPIRRRLNRDTRFNLLARMQEDNEAFLDFYLLPSQHTLGRHLNFRKQNQSRLGPFRLTTLEGASNALESLSQTDSVRVRR
jgi:hypothetical protein